MRQGVQGRSTGMTLRDGMGWDGMGWGRRWEGVQDGEHMDSLG